MMTGHTLEGLMVPTGRLVEYGWAFGSVMRVGESFSLGAKMGLITYLVGDGQKQVAAQVPHLPDANPFHALHHRCLPAQSESQEPMANERADGVGCAVR